MPKAEKAGRQGLGVIAELVSFSEEGRTPFTVILVPRLGTHSIHPWAVSCLKRVIRLIDSNVRPSTPAKGGRGFRGSYKFRPSCRVTPRDMSRGRQGRYMRQKIRPRRHIINTLTQPAGNKA